MTNWHAEEHVPVPEIVPDKQDPEAPEESDPATEDDDEKRDE
jgi:hypothetical protein